MSVLDYLVVIGYLLLSLSLGLLFCKQSSRDEFFTASRSMGKMTVGLSVMATLFSANSFVMYPSVAYGDSIRILIALVAFWSMGPVVIWIFIPVFARLRCATAYEYLEHRFNVSVRCLASSLFILLRISWMASATYAASLAIAGIAEIPVTAIIVGLGVIAIAYTMLGGLRAVMWTDVMQFFVFFGTIVFATVLLVWNADNGVTGIVKTYFADRDNLVVDWSLDPTVKYATIAVFLGSFLEGLSAFGADQVAVQRYLAARDQRTSQIGFFINLLGMLIVIPGLVVIGMGLFSYFHQNPDGMVSVVVEKAAESLGSDDSKAAEIHERLSGLVDASSPTIQEAAAEFYRGNPRQLHADAVDLKLNDQALPQFVRQQFPAGVVGLLIAALMAATMSSIDSGIHSVTTAMVVDFRDRLLPNCKPKTEVAEMFSARLMIVLVGTISIVLACYVGQLGDVFTVAKKCVSAFAAPLLSIFVLGLFVKRAKGPAVFVGTWLGAAFTLAIMSLFPDWFSMWFFVVGFAGSFAISAVLSLLPFGGPSESKPLTFRNVMRQPIADQD